METTEISELAILLYKNLCEVSGEQYFEYKIDFGPIKPEKPYSINYEPILDFNKK